MTRHAISKIVGWSALSLSLVVSGACNREPAPATETREEAASPNDTTAERQQERMADVTRLNERVSELEKRYTEANKEVASGARTATAGLREELKEDVANVREAVRDLGSTTPENWWDRHEQALSRTADDIEADVRRIAAGTAPAPARTATADGKNVDATAPFTSRRDAFVTSLKARVEAMEQALDKVKASGARETEVADTRARISKLEDDLNRLGAASAEDWWDVSKARVTDYVDRVEASVGRLDDNKPAR